MFDEEPLGPGDTLDRRYLIERQLGRGGLGSAYAARDLVLDAPVAIKLLRRPSPQRLEVFRREFLLLSGLVHPQLTRVHDFGCAKAAGREARYYYSCDVVEGVPLDEHAAGRSWAEVQAPVVDALLGLAFLHRLGIRHGDFKPGNVLVRSSGAAVLIDLSCSARIGEGEGEVSGTTDFLAPEVVGTDRGVLDHRADLYAVGVTLKRLSAVLRGSPPASVRRMVEQLVRRRPQERPGDVTQLLAVLGVSDPELAVATPEPPALFEREQQMADFGAALDALVRGAAGPRAICVRGAEGSGRTRLLCEMKWRAQLACGVIEGSVLEPRAASALLARSLGAEIGDDLDSLLSARDRLAAATEPVVLVLDDAQALGDLELERLQAIARSMQTQDRFLMVWTTTDLAPTMEAGSVLELPPLGRDSVASWASSLLAASRVDDLMRASGGYPASVRQLLAGIATGALTEDDLGRGDSEGRLSQRRAERVRRLPEAARRALALLAVRGAPMSDDELLGYGVAAATVEVLSHDGTVQRHATTWKLSRAAEAGALLSAVDASVVAWAHAIVADRLLSRLAADRDDGGVVAAALVHLVCADRTTEADALFARAPQMASDNPHGWPRAADAMCSRSNDHETLLRAADVQRICGQPRRALELLTALLKKRPDQPSRAAARWRIGATLLHLGDAARALRYLERAGEQLSGDAETSATLADLTSRALILRGSYARAYSCAAGALPVAPSRPLRAALHEDMGVAASYQGEAAEARRLLEIASGLYTEASAPRATLRSVSHRAFHEYRSGNSLGAANFYREAMDIAERHGLTDKIASCALSYGAACHQNGRWGDALSSYQRGLRVAVALGQTSNEVTLRFDLAKLAADTGQLERAEAGAARARELAERAGLPFFVAAACTVHGEVALSRGDASRAIAEFERARDSFAREGALREEVEALLHLCDAHRGAGDLRSAQSCLDLAESKARALEARDVDARCALARGRLLGEAGRDEAATAALEHAAALARQVGQLVLAAEVEVALAHAWRRAGAEALADRHRTVAREHLERIAAGLEPHQRSSFWAHPSRRELPRRDGPMQGERVVTQKLRRLVEINKKLSSSLSTDEVLSRTMDAAVELTGAERGFLIVRGDGRADGLTVAVARNIDRAQLATADLEFSKSIAERTIATGEPVITVDAGSDERFARNESVHAMRLKSVICVPIRGTEATVGALYLDNRFRSGTFSVDDLDLLVAFGDQVAIALTNARLHHELERRAAELEVERRRVEELTHAQAEQIDRLAEQVRDKQQLLEHRYDYSAIIGRGPRMQAVLATLDRVIDTAVTILVQGESGTGKELVARAVHYNGARREQAFVGINCGAVPSTLLESELFGHVRGAFTGADRDREGLFVEARGGTLFLDELGEMGADMQVKLLRVLQEREVRPVGAARAIPIDVRLVCATNRKLRDEVAAGRFREDLFYRIGVVELELPALRDRTEDLPELIHHLLVRIAAHHGRPAPRLTKPAMKLLLGYDWPGNVRELENVLTNAILLADAAQLGPTDFRLPSRSTANRGGPASRKEFRQGEREHIHALLRAHRWNVSEVARALGVARATLYRKLRQYGLEVGPS